MVKFLQKYFQKHNAKKNLQIIILHVLQLLKKDKKQNKNKKKTNKQETVLVRSPTNFSEDDVQLLIPAIVVHTVHEYK